MAWPPEIATFDAWIPRAREGEVERLDFRGPQGLHRLHGPQRVLAPAAEDFEARLTRRQLPDCAIERFAATPHASVRGLQEIRAFPIPLMTVVLVKRGSLRVELADRSFAVPAGYGVLLDSRHPTSCVALGDVEMFRAVARSDVVGGEVLGGRRLSGPLAPSALSSRISAFVSAGLQPANAAPADVGDLRSAVLQVVSAVVSNARDAVEDENGPAQLRDRVAWEVDTRYTDARLDAGAIARALGVDVQRVRAVYEDGSHTVERAIRSRRVRAALLELHLAADDARLRRVAEHCGFDSVDGMSRALLEETGRTIDDLRGD